MIVVGGIVDAVVGVKGVIVGVALDAVVVDEDATAGVVGGIIGCKQTQESP